MELTKMELIITQNNDNGMFGGPYISDFEYTYKGVLYRAIIEQGGIRKNTNRYRYNSRTC